MTKRIHNDYGPDAVVQALKHILLKQSGPRAAAGFNRGYLMDLVRLCKFPAPDCTRDKEPRWSVLTLSEGLKSCCIKPPSTGVVYFDAFAFVPLVMGAMNAAEDFETARGGRA